MSFSYTLSAQPESLSGSLVTVEVDIARGRNSFSIVGMASKSVDEARDRVATAIKNSGFLSPELRTDKVVVSLAPAELKKTGSYHDLAVALAYLLASGELSFLAQGKLFVGELSLDGRVKSVQGILPLVLFAKHSGVQEIYVPYENVKEAALVDGITIYGVIDLLSVVRHLDPHRSGHCLIAPVIKAHIEPSVRQDDNPFIDIRGQEFAKRGLLIAALGRHHVLLYGPPGTGKTMLAQSFRRLLPPLSREASLEVTAIHSIAGTLAGVPITFPPFRNPHHTASYAAMVGGGAQPKPGEVTLAHRGVLFLDEFPEFDKRVIESLRQPIEDGKISIARSQSSAVFPSSFILIAAMNPCPCGFYGSKVRNCTCSFQSIERYQSKISGPITDRIDLWIPVEQVDSHILLNIRSVSRSSQPSPQETLVDSRRFRESRITLFQKTSSCPNNIFDLELESFTEESITLLHESTKKFTFSPRSVKRVVGVARTIADLERSAKVEKQHLLEALQYRPRGFSK